MAYTRKQVHSISILLLSFAFAFGQPQPGSESCHITPTEEESAGNQETAPSQAFK